MPVQPGGRSHGITRAEIIATAVVGGCALLTLSALAVALCIYWRARSSAKVGLLIAEVYHSVCTYKSGLQFTFSHSAHCPANCPAEI
jgi:hypothetical protein